MKIFNADLKPMKILKIAGLALVVIIVIAIAIRLIGPSISSLLPRISSISMDQSAPGFNAKVRGEMAYGGASDGIAVGLSTRNVVSPSIAPTSHTTGGKIITGDNAEDLEVTQYNANIETRSLEKTCGSIATLKSRKDVIFENANKYEKGCNYTFKVKHSSVAEILTIIKSLDPKELNENTYTIKALVDDYTSEVEILKKKITSIEETLNGAVSAYDEVTKLATKTQNVESLAKIIDSKIGIIERLTQERININAELERLDRSKSEQLDRLDYTYFNVNVIENKFVDIQNLKDSWSTAVKSFVNDINKVLQDISINLVTLLFLALQYILYIFIILIIAKYGWKLVKYIWKR